MLQNEYLVAEIGVDTAENERWKESCVVAKVPAVVGAVIFYFEACLKPTTRHLFTLWKRATTLKAPAAARWWWTRVRLRCSAREVLPGPGVRFV